MFPSPLMMRRLARARRWPLALVSLLAIAGCAGSFSEAFPSPRRSPRPAVAQPVTGPPVPASYAGLPPASYGPAGYYGYGPAPDPGQPAAGAPGSTTWDRPVPEPPPAAAPAACDDSCDLANDGECDDGREGAGSDLCVPGTDCSDCGA